MAVDWDEFTRIAADNERDAEVQASRIEHLEQLLQRLRRRHEQLESDAAVRTGSGCVGRCAQSLAAEIEDLEDRAELLETKLMSR